MLLGYSYKVSQEIEQALVLRFSRLASLIFVLDVATATHYQEFGVLLLLLCCFFTYRMRTVAKRSVERRPSDLGMICRLFSEAYIWGCLTFLLILGTLGQPILYAFRMFAYPSDHPASYIAILAISFGFCGSFWIRRFGNSKKIIVRRLTLFLLPCLIVLLSSPFAGVLWVVHDWHHGFFPGLQQAFEACVWGAGAGVVIGPILFLGSQPLSGLAALFCWARLHQISAPQHQSARRPKESS